MGWKMIWYFPVPVCVTNLPPEWGYDTFGKIFSGLCRKISSLPEGEVIIAESSHYTGLDFSRTESKILLKVPAFETDTLMSITYVFISGL
ncbi:MAG: hypothetical protein MUP55_04540 [Candidatus Aenigmarchaeota archaeon]|nr:hypothetical protein [Candidatus Aenigmarchaeota archaeon]